MEDIKEKEIETNEIAQMRAQIELLTKLVGNNTLNNNVGLSPDDVIEFESTTLSPMYLSTEGNGKGEIYHFESFGTQHNIPINQAREILRHNKNFIQKGYVYIKNENFVKKENLSHYYQNLASASELNNILLCKKDSFSERFSKLNNTQKETVCGMIFDKIKEGKNVDEEILFYVHKKMGRDIAEEVSQLKILLSNED